MLKKRMLPVLLFLLVLCECGTEERSGENFGTDRRKSLVAEFADGAPGYFVIGGQKYGYCTEILDAYADASGRSLETISKAPAGDVWNNLENRSTDIGIAPTREVDPGALALEICSTGYVVLGRSAGRRSGALAEVVGDGVVWIVPSFQRTATYDALLDTLSGAQLYVCSRECYELAAEVAEGRGDFLICEASAALMSAEFLRGLAVVHRFEEKIGVSLVFPSSDPELFYDFSRWWKSYETTSGASELKRAYFERGPARRFGTVGRNNRVVDGISVWDDLIRKVGQREGVDWRLLSAIAYKESRFRHDVTSHMGATGLMQIMPVTARHFKVEQTALSDPETNITLAAKLIKNIGASLGFSPDAAQEDMLCIILAAYNCGIGTVTDARRLAAAQGWNPDRWASVAQCLELMGDIDYRSDSVTFRQFRGYGETLAFVDGVREKYDTYRRTVQ